MAKTRKQEIHGASPSVTSIYDLAGLKTSNYSHKTREDYEAWVKGIPLTDLQNHAIDVGLVPVDNRELLMERLIRNYCKEMSGKLEGLPVMTNIPSKKSESKLRDLLKAGR